MLLKLQQKLKSLEFEKDKLTEKIDSTERFISGSPYNDRARDSFKVSGISQLGVKFTISIEFIFDYSFQILDPGTRNGK